eukprot:TRINITY_DN3291_c0_g5_i1.p1 TRINITY_DN3291_c0_g5~~TRINITY_DN3291_c0_g5_i1.p1  ORF type:complete len:1014 (+),score=232.11 TRINITY_DN3291_c0_g5_i1:220-3042(+)
MTKLQSIIPIGIIFSEQGLSNFPSNWQMIYYEVDWLQMVTFSENFHPLVKDYVFICCDCTTFRSELAVDSSRNYHFLETEKMNFTSLTQTKNELFSSFDIKSTILYYIDGKKDVNNNTLINQQVVTFLSKLGYPMYSFKLFLLNYGVLGGIMMDWNSISSILIDSLLNIEAGKRIKLKSIAYLDYQKIPQFSIETGSISKDVVLVNKPIDIFEDDLVFLFIFVCVLAFELVLIVIGWFNYEKIRKISQEHKVEMKQLNILLCQIESMIQLVQKGEIIYENKDHMQLINSKVDSYLIYNDILSFECHQSDYEISLPGSTSSRTLLSSNSLNSANTVSGKRSSSRFTSNVGEDTLEQQRNNIIKRLLVHGNIPPNNPFVLHLGDKYLEISTKLIKWIDNDYAKLSVCHDVTEKMDLLNSIAESERYLTAVLNGINDMVLTVNEDYYVCKINTSAGKLLQSMNFSLPNSSGENGPLINDIFDFFFIPPEFHGSISPKEALNDVIQNHLPFYRTDCFIQRKDTLDVFLFSVHPLLFKKYLPGVVIILKDVSEKFLLKKQVYETEKMADMGKLAGSVAHDFRNLLLCQEEFNAKLQQIAEYSPHLSKHKKLFKAIEKATESAFELTRSLLKFSKPDKSSRLTDMNLHDYIENNLTFFKATFGQQFSVLLNFEANSANIKGDELMLSSIFTNFLLNSKDASANTFIIRTTNVSVTKETQLRTGTVLTVGNYIQVTCEDNGEGISPKNLDKIFNPFFTTKGVANGTGMGLSTVFSTVKELQGAITVTSLEKTDNNEGKTMMTIFFPIQGTSISSKPIVSGPKNTVVLRKGLRALHVEDEPMIADILSMGLLKLDIGYKWCETGEIGLKEFVDHMDVYDMVFLDSSLPGMSGKQVLAKIRELNPTFPVIFFSGWDQDHLEVHDEYVSWLNKPYVQEQLEELLGKLFSR